MSCPNLVDNTDIIATDIASPALLFPFCPIPLAHTTLIMSDSEKTTSPTAAPEKPRSTAEADVTKYKVRALCPQSLN